MRRDSDAYVVFYVYRCDALLLPMICEVVFGSLSKNDLGYRKLDCTVGPCDVSPLSSCWQLLTQSWTARQSILGIVETLPMGYSPHPPGTDDVAGSQWSTYYVRSYHFSRNVLTFHTRHFIVGCMCMRFCRTCLSNEIMEF